MLLIITALSAASAGELTPTCPAALPCGDAYRFELEGIDAPPRSSHLTLGSDWQRPTPARLTANTVITAGGLALTLLSVHMLQDGAALPGDLVPGQAILAGVGGGVLLLGGSAMWLTTDFSADRSGVQKGFAIRGVW
jgi:hypothetical protein